MADGGRTIRIWNRVMLSGNICEETLMLLKIMVVLVVIESIPGTSSATISALL
jgi:hypothetical protein